MSPSLLPNDNPCFHFYPFRLFRLLSVSSQASGPFYFINGSKLDRIQFLVSSLTLSHITTLLHHLSSTISAGFSFKSFYSLLFPISLTFSTFTNQGIYSSIIHSWSAYYFAPVTSSNLCNFGDRASSSLFNRASFS